VCLATRFYYKIKIKNKKNETKHVLFFNLSRVSIKNKKNETKHVLFFNLSRVFKESGRV
jgi:hypothetical protein